MGPEKKQRQILSLVAQKARHLAVMASTTAHQRLAIDVQRFRDIRELADSLSREIDILTAECRADVVETRVINAIWTGRNFTRSSPTAAPSLSSIWPTPSDWWGEMQPRTGRFEDSPLAEHEPDSSASLLDTTYVWIEKPTIGQRVKLLSDRLDIPAESLGTVQGYSQVPMSQDWIVVRFDGDYRNCVMHAQYLAPLK